MSPPGWTGRVPSIVQPRAGEDRLARERSAETIDGERGENQQDEERGPCVPGGGVGRQRELQAVAEVIGKDPGEQAEAQEDEDEGGADNEAEGARNQATGEKRRHGLDQHEDGRREPLLPEDRAQKKEEQRGDEREKHGDRGVEDLGRYGSRAPQRRIPREGRDRRCRLDGTARELQGFLGDGRENAEQ